MYRFGRVNMQKFNDDSLLYLIFVTYIKMASLYWFEIKKYFQCIFIRKKVIKKYKLIRQLLK